MNVDKLKALYVKYDLTKDDVYKHQHYIIITRSGIDKIQAKEQFRINYDVVQCSPNFCVVKANASKENAVIETFDLFLNDKSYINFLFSIIILISIV